MRLNSLIVGLVATEHAEQHYGGPEGIVKVAQTVPMLRMGTPADVAGACLFLGSDLAAFISGAALSVHGGGEAPAFLSVVESALAAARWRLNAATQRHERSLMTGICDGRVVIVTGAGRGLGREHALEFARQGARVVVNDYGTALDGGGRSTEVADAVVDEIKALGGDAVANADDVADWQGAQNLINTAVEAWGQLDTLVNNAGFVRDRMLANMSEEEWDAVIRVHLKGHFAPLHHAAAYWRAQSKAGSPASRLAIVNTSSGAGLLGSVGQGNYGAAKAGIAALTQIAAAEMGRLRRHRQRDRSLPHAPA